ncbi:PEP/pyruvate-binding domain-containing protein [Dactylosporangium sp. CA-139114]|uniref:PEP/pyruvate-binding domain-containing protein n=1 Tax=Dactylosporangium sp. CA-139114 TaxID=3239931 RepID=UPI003D98A593
MIDLLDADPRLFSRMGGKAAGLSILTRHRQRVPPTAFLPADLVPQGGEADLAWLRRTGAQIAKWARARHIWHLAIRSSATVEDQEKHSYAGIFRSAFAPVTDDLIAAALADVVRSAVSPQRTAYEQGIGRSGSGELGVVVQATVPARSSGVAFGWRSGGQIHRMIEGTWGMSLDMVSGISRGDTLRSSSADTGSTSLRVHRKPLAVYPLVGREFRPGDAVVVDAHEPTEAKVVYVDEEAGLAYLRLGATAAECACISDDLAALIDDAIDATLPIHPSGVDIEWVEDPDGRLWLVQLRPLTATPDIPAPNRPRAPGLVTGEPGAPGRWRGPVSHPEKVTSYSAADGRVLVCGAARPELLPAIARAAAIVSSDGGMLCHVAIIARELGKPCVIGVPDADRLLPDDVIVEVDGTAGTVERVKATASVADAEAPEPKPTASGIVFRFPDDLGATTGPEPAVLVLTPYAPQSVVVGVAAVSSQTVVAACDTDQQTALRDAGWLPRGSAGTWRLYARDSVPDELVTRVTDEIVGGGATSWHA